MQISGEKKSHHRGAAVKIDFPVAGFLTVAVLPHLVYTIPVSNLNTAAAVFKFHILLFPRKPRKTIVQFIR
jgi:hypothetical protein